MASGSGIRPKHIVVVGVLIFVAVKFWPSTPPPCPEYGDAIKGSKKAHINELKNRPIEENGDPIEFSIALLLKDGEDSSNFKEDGTYGYVDGYVLSGGEQGPESCNCKMASKSKKDGDIHFFVSDKKISARTKKYDCFIAEITPAYKEIYPDVDAHQYDRKHVRIYGYLMYDAEHRGNSIATCRSCDLNNPSSAIWRKTCWEIHPIVKIEELD